MEYTTVSRRALSLDVQTTHGYVTVFQEDVIRHYQAHLAGPPCGPGRTGIPDSDHH